MENITLKKISMVLGISISTVSRALKDHPDISNQTKQRVKELAETLDYEPNANAINLRTKNNNVFGLMIPSATNSFYNSFLAALEEECRAIGFSLIIMQSADDPDNEKNILRLFRQNRVNGIFACLSPRSHEMEMIHKLKDISIPVIFFDKVPDTEHNKVCLDDTGAAILAARILHVKKKRHILALFGNKQLSITKKRHDAFMRVFEKDEKVTVWEGFVNNSEEAYQTTCLHFKSRKKPDAVFCMSDEILTGCMKGLQQMGIEYPKKCGIISISDGFIPKLYYPEITYVETSGYKLGKLAFEYMHASINNVAFNKSQLVDSKLYKGGSL